MADTTYYVDTDIVDDGHGGTSWADAFDHLSDVEALNLNLTTGATDGVCTINCKGATADSTAMDWDGWTTDAAGYVNIVGDFYGTQYDTTKYELAPATGAASDAIGIKTEYFRVSHIQVTVESYNGSNGFKSALISAGSDIRIAGCLVRGDGGTTTQSGIISYDDDDVMKIYNCIVYGFAGAFKIGICLEGAGTLNVYNCTVAGCTNGIKREAGTMTATNCAVFNNSDDFNGTITIDYCASDDADGTNAQNFTAEATDWNKVFTDYATGDFSLKNYSTAPCCVGVGTDNPGAGLYSDDITGAARTSTWDIGADEYIAAAGGSIVPQAMKHYIEQSQ